jgi:hypothetical protein
MLDLVAANDDSTANRAAELRAAIQFFAGASRRAVSIAQREGFLTPEQVEAVDGLPEDDAAIIANYTRRVLASQPGEPGEHGQLAADALDADVDATQPMPAQEARGHG